MAMMIAATRVIPQRGGSNGCTPEVLGELQRWQCVNQQLLVVSLAAIDTLHGTD
jgi:hypothetical protein